MRDRGCPVDDFDRQAIVHYRALFDEPLIPGDGGHGDVIELRDERGTITATLTPSSTGRGPATSRATRRIAGDRLT
jgi:hypothetical protein